MTETGSAQASRRCATRASPTPRSRRSRTTTSGSWPASRACCPRPRSSRSRDVPDAGDLAARRRRGARAARPRRGDQAQRRPRHLHGHDRGQVAARGQGRADASSTSSPARCSHLRERTGARLPLVFMNSFRTRDDTLAALARYADLAGRRAADFLQNKEPKLRADDLTPVELARRPRARVVPARPRRPLHRAARLRAARRAARARLPSTRSSPTPTTSAPCPTRAIVAWFAARAAPFAHGGRRPHARPTARAGTSRAQARRPDRAARDRADARRGRRGASRTSPPPLLQHQQPLGRPARARRADARRRDGILGLPLILNGKTVDPGDPASTAGDPDRDRDGRGDRGLRGRAARCACRGAASRPVKTTNDLLVLRSDAYVLTDDARVELAPARAGATRRSSTSTAATTSSSATSTRASPRARRRWSAASGWRSRATWRSGATSSCAGACASSTTSGSQRRIPDGAVLEG